jgi:hypothetical protein
MANSETNVVARPAVLIAVRVARPAVLIAVRVARPAVLIAALVKIHTFRSVARCRLENSYGLAGGRNFVTYRATLISVFVRFVLIDLKSQCLAVTTSID